MTAELLQSALRPAGPQAAHIHGLFTLLAWVAAAVWVVVVIALAAAVLRGRRRTGPALDPASERRAGAAVTVAAGATAALILTLLIADLLVGRRLVALPGTEPALTVEVFGNQWWWEIHYEHAEAHLRLTTAGELHIPVGVPVLVKLRSRDVIHSFWVPSLHGKQDLIPGYTNTILLQADRPGEYHGQCAEYCGHQHAHMRLLVVAHPMDEFLAWREAQLRPAAGPATDEARRGRDLFLAGPCVMCHTVRGTPASARTGPELTHVGSRRTIGSGVLPMSAANLARWIADPHAIKPGVHMPAHPFGSSELQALAAYLEGLR